jgi:hypothetical protein
VTQIHTERLGARFGLPFFNRYRYRGEKARKLREKQRESVRKSEKIQPILSLTLLFPESFSLYIDVLFKTVVFVFSFPENSIKLNFLYIEAHNLNFFLLISI